MGIVTDANRIKGVPAMPSHLDCCLDLWGNLVSVRGHLCGFVLMTCELSGSCTQRLAYTSSNRRKRRVTGHWGPGRQVNFTHGILPIFAPAFAEKPHLVGGSS